MWKNQVLQEIKMFFKNITSCQTCKTFLCWLARPAPSREWETLWLEHIPNSLSWLFTDQLHPALGEKARYRNRQNSVSRIWCKTWRRDRYQKTNTRTSKIFGDWLESNHYVFSIIQKSSPQECNCRPHAKDRGFLVRQIL